VSQAVYRFGPFVLDTADYRLTKGGVAVELTPKAFELLRSLVEQAGTLVTKERLFDRIWPDVAVTDNALTQVVSDLRAALGDTSGAPTYVQTVARRGYRFVADVRPGHTEPSEARFPSIEGIRPVLIVADFQNVGRDADLDWLSSGIAETVTGTLGGRHDIRVQDRARLLAFGDRPDSPLDQARGAGAGLLVTGAFQHVLGQLRLTARLIDVATGDVRADARADGPIQNIFALQDDVARQLSDALGGVRPGGARPARHTSSLEAYRAAVEGRLLLESLDPDVIHDALARFTTAIERDPGYAAAHVGLANARGYLYERTRHRPDPQPGLLRQAVEDCRRAIALDDAFAEAHATLSFLLVAAGDREGARRAATRAVALEPDEWMHRFRFGHASWGTARLEALSRVLTSFPDFPFAYFQRAMVFIARGSLDKAAATLEEGLRVAHDDRPRRFPGAGLRWLLGMIALATGSTDEAVRLFSGELQTRQSTLYTEEFALGARLGMGFVQLAKGRVPDAVQTFGPLVASDGSGRALLGLVLAARRVSSPDAASQPLDALERAARAERAGGRAEGAAMLEAAIATARGDEATALRLLEAAMQTAPPGPLGWTLPIDPVFSSLRGTPRMTAILSALAARAG
jgi:DNA-binding winged helix-turn-helix (wHTH) protein/tetratricopeptide (TPR) repeat protein